MGDVSELRPLGSGKVIEVEATIQYVVSEQGLAITYLKTKIDHSTRQFNCSAP